MKKILFSVLFLVLSFAGFAQTRTPVNGRYQYQNVTFTTVLGIPDSLPILANRVPWMIYAHPADSTLHVWTGFTDITLGAGGGGGSTLPGFGIRISNDSASIDTINSYYHINPVLGLNNKIVGGGNSNGAGFNNGGIVHSYSAVANRHLDSTVAGYTLDVLAVSGQTTQDMIANDPVTIDTAFDASKVENYLFAWEVENDADLNSGLTPAQLAAHMNTYWTDRNLAGFRTIGSTGLPRVNSSNAYDSLLLARIYSADSLLVLSHTSDLFINFLNNPWLNNNMSRAGYGPDYIHMNPSGTLTMADSFTNAVKRDQGQPITYPTRPVFWGGNNPDRTMLLGALNGNGVSLIANGMPVFDVTPAGGIGYIGRRVAEAANAPNVAFWIRPSFLNPNGLAGVSNTDIGINGQSQWINTYGQKVAFFNPGVGGSGVLNFGIGNNVFNTIDANQSTNFANTGLGTNIFQATTLGNYNTIVGGLIGDTHTSSQNVFVAAGLNLGTIGDQNTWVGAGGGIGAPTGSASFGYGITQHSDHSIAIGNSISVSGTSNNGGTLAIGWNRNDGGFNGAILIANVESEIYGTGPTGDGQCILGSIYDASGYAGTTDFLLGGNKAINSTISSAFQAIHLRTRGILGGGSNTNLSASASEFAIEGSTGTGNAQSGDITFATGQATASGTTEQALVKVLRVGADQTVRIYGPMYPPQYTTVEKLALTVTEGAQVYDTTLHQMSYYNGTAWVNY